MTSRFGTPIRHAEQGCKDRPALNLKQLLSVLTKMYMTRFPNKGDQAEDMADKVCVWQMSGLVLWSQT